MIYGKKLAIGAWANDINGSDLGPVRVYCREDDGSSWKKIGQDINGEGAGDSLGVSVSLSSYGKTLAIGAM